MKSEGSGKGKEIRVKEERGKREGANQRTMRLVVAFIAVFITLMFGLEGVWAETASPDGLMQKGAIAFQRGAFNEAFATWKESARLYEAAGQVKEQSQALMQAAQAAQAAGKFRPALQHLELALTLAQQLGDPIRIATILDGLGRAYLGTRQMDAAASYLDQALAMARAHGDPLLNSAVLNDVGILRAAQFNYTEALAAYTESASLAQATGHPALAVRATINAAVVALRLQQPDEVRSLLEQAFDEISRFPPSFDKAHGLVNIGLAYANLRPFMEAMSDRLLLRAAVALNDAAAIAKNIGDARTQSYALGHLGHLYETEHRYGEALSLSRQAVFTAQSANAPESLYRWQWQMGRVLASSNKLDEAIAAYRSSTYSLEPIRLEVALAAQAPGSSGRESMRPLYVEYADLLLHRAALMDEGSDSQGYLKAARDAVEASKAAELRDYFHDQCVDAVQGRVTSLEAISPTTAIVYTIVFTDRTELLVSLPTGLKRISVPVSSARLTEEVRAFRRRLETRTSREYLVNAQQLYNWLVRVLEPDLAASKIDTLVFVPDGPLRTIPMAALHDGKHFLISKFAIATTPGMNLTDPHPINRAKVSVLSSGLTEATQGFPPLPHVLMELQTIRALYGGDQLINEAFIVPSLEKELKERRISVLHIASHGRFEKDVAHSYILTYDDKLTMERLDQYVGLFKFRQDPLELLTLSACETAMGDDQAALGLAGVAIKAGARSALATLWSINDKASSALVAEFYRQLSDASVSKAMALQRAQLKMLQGGAYDHPAYWSPFLLLNNWL
jgi:CHAT domain-containing protein